MQVTELPAQPLAFSCELTGDLRNVDQVVTGHGRAEASVLPILCLGGCWVVWCRKRHGGSDVRWTPDLTLTACWFGSVYL